MSKNGEGEHSLEEGEIPAETVFSDGDKASTPVSTEKLLKRVLKKKRKLVSDNRGSSVDYYDVYGPKARASVDVHEDANIKLQDVNGIVTWAIGSGMNPPWCFLKNKPLVRKVVLLLVGGIDSTLWEQSAGDVLPNTKRIFGRAGVVALNPSLGPGKAASILLSCPMSKNMRKKKQKLARRDPFPPSYYVLKLNEMESLNYPLPVVDGKSISPPEGYAATAPGDGSRDGKLVGLDCEMCWTKEGLELTRVTLVDEDGMVLLDEFVMPTNQITDYNTKYSGITEEMLKGVTTTLEDVRHKVMEIVHDKTLLVGHGLENDLRSLRLLHANCIDTVVLYPHPKGLPHRPSLRFLAEKFLKKSIQGERHDSIEDASSAMKLAKLKFKHGPSWGTGSMPNMEPLVDTLARDGCRCALVASSTSLRHNAQGSADAIVAETDDQSLEKIKQKARQEDIHFIWGQWSDIGNFQAERASVRKELSSMGVALDPSCPHLDDAADADRRRHHPAAGGGVAPGNGAAGDPHAAERGSGGASYGQVLRRVDDRVAELWEGLEPNTLLVLVSGHGDSSEARRLQETKCRRTQETPLDGLPAWTARDEELAQALVKRTGRTICLAAVRQ